MAGRLSFSIAINLLTENFKRGTNQVKAAFRSMQMQILTFAAALGAGGLGLSNLVSRFIDVARETNRVTTALKNVSGTMSQYADNQKYLLDLAKKYGLEINALTANYAKFTAAASISGMSMIDQRKVFESVSRACTAFGMSADDSNGVMLALSQMMSKGKISSEELRLQMGERLPVALQAMAKAAGVSVAGLDKLLKQGKLMSKDVLPKFAEALNEMIPNVDTDNLETSVNRLKNVFTELVNGTDIQSKYKALIDWLTGAMQSLGNNLKNILTLAFAAIVFVATSAATKVWRSWSAAYDNTAASGERASAQAIRATERRVAVEGTLAVKKKVELAALAEYEVTLANGTAQEVIAAEVAKDKAVRARMAAESSLEKARAAEQKVLEKEKQISATTSAMAGANGFKKASIIIGSQAKRLMISLKSMWNTFAPAIIISVIVGLIGYFRSLREEAERVKKIFTDYKKESERVTHTPEIIQLKVIQDLYNKAVDGSKQKEKYQNRIIELLGGELKKNQDINDAVRERIKLLEATAKTDYFTRKKIEAEDKLKGLYDNRGGEEAFNFQYQNAKENEGIINFGGQAPIIQEMEEAAALRKIITDADANIREYTEFLEKNKTSIPTVPPYPDDDKKKKTPLQKQQESYDKQFEELGAELEIGKITQAEYNKALGELNIKMYAQAKGTGDKEVLESQYFQNRKTAAEKAIRNQDKNAALVEFEKVQKDYNTKVREAQAQQAQGLISQKELNSNIVSLSVEAAKSAAGIKGIGDEADVFISAMQLNAKILASPIKIKPRDATFDYKKTKVDIASENLDKAKELADKYKEEARIIGKTLSDEIANAMANVPSMEEALKLAQVQEDIKNFGKELDESLYSGVKDIASGSDRIVNAFSNLRDVMNDVDATEWERIMAIWNTLTNVIDSFMSICKMIENITELTNKLTKAKEIEGVIEKQASDKKIIGAVKEMAVDTASAETKKANSRGVVAANTAEAATAAGKSVAGIPIVGIALAAAAVAGIVALFATLPKFARGGIIGGGPTSGDKMLARVNAGEMILNQGQQSHLFEAINSGRLGGGGNISSSVTTRVRAKDLILTINNELKSQGKKPIS